MGYSAGEDPATVLLLACPKADLEAAHALCLTVVALCYPLAAVVISAAPLGLAVHCRHRPRRRGLSRPVGPVARSAWGGELPLDAEQFYSLLPPTWMARHPGAYERARVSTRRTDDGNSEADPWERQWELDGEPVHDEGEPKVASVYAGHRTGAAKPGPTGYSPMNSCRSRRVAVAAFCHASRPWCKLPE